MSSQFFRDLAGLLEQHPRLAMATVVAAVGSTPREAAARMLVLPDGTTRGTIGGGKFESLVLEDARALLSRRGLPVTKEYVFLPEGKNSFGAVCGGKATVMLEIVERSPRLLVVGAGHCGRALARAAAITGFQLTVCDERGDQLDPSAFPEGTRLVTVADDYADLPLPAPPDFVAVITRGHVTDGLALRRLRGTPVAYLGMMGSRAKRKALFDDLRAEGWREEEFARIQSPIGLDIGAESPEEIAIAIVAELIKTRRGGSGGRR
ncbi:MAG TPA: XdhC/CoxI family protein [Thermoanaerobaculia bacterium]|nr:XdhC/CoxI family protein [Thermoanaerobaculia bacterium]